MSPPKWKQTGDQTTNPKGQSKVTHDVEASGSGSVTLGTWYIPLRKDDALHVQFKKKSKYMLVEKVIPKVIHVSRNIMPNLNKFSFTNHDLRKYNEFQTYQYMESV